MTTQVHQSAMATALLKATDGDLNNLKMKEGDYAYYETPMGKESMKRMAEKQAKHLTDLRLVKDISTLNNGKTFHQDLHEAVGIDPVFAKGHDPRVLRIDIRTGMAVNDDTPKRWYREVILQTPIVSYSLLQTNDGQVGFAIIGCTTTTTYMFLRDDLAYSFQIETSSLNAQEAILKLYSSNLSKGRGLFIRSASLIPGFFWKAFSAVHQLPVKLNFQVLHSSGNQVAMGLYLDPRDHSKCMVSANGWVFPIDLNEFPLQQISRGYNMKAKADRNRRGKSMEQRREAIANSEGRPYMNATERQRMIDRHNRG